MIGLFGAWRQITMLYSADVGIEVVYPFANSKNIYIKKTLGGRENGVEMGGLTKNKGR